MVLTIGPYRTYIPYFLPFSFLEKEEEFDATHTIKA
jgi:hypothetical protein